MRIDGRLRWALIAATALGPAGCASDNPRPPAMATTATPTSPTTAPTVTTAPPVAPPTTGPSPSTVSAIRSAPASIDAILAGTKTSTTRKGKRAYALGPATTTDGRRRVNIVITRIEPKRVGNLTAADAASDGSPSLAAYRAALRHSYPGLTDDDLVSVVHFQLADQN